MPENVAYFQLLSDSGQQQLRLDGMFTPEKQDAMFWLTTVYKFIGVSPSPLRGEGGAVLYIY